MSSDLTGLFPPDRRKLVATPELLRALVIKELKIKYKRSVLGFLWSLITPIALTGVYLFLFVYVKKVGDDDFVLFLLSGLLPWHFFNMSILASTVSLVENGSLIRKVYFPRVLLPISTVLANLINFLMGLGLLAVVLVISGRPVYANLHWLLLAIAMETALCVGLALLLSIGNVYFRDIQQMISILMMTLFFATPIVYRLSEVPRQFRPVILANPLSAVIETYRAALFDGRAPDLSVVAIGLGEIALVLALGYFVFKKIGPHLAKEV